MTLSDGTTYVYNKVNIENKATLNHHDMIRSETSPGAL